MIIDSPILNSADALFHYTKASTAIEYILHTNELWLTPRHQMNDPVENVQPQIIYDCSGPKPNWWTEQTEDDCYSLGKKMERMWQNAKQVSFCMNDVKQQPLSGHSAPHEYYGFLKPRMWDQYGDKYRGVCLIFSKNKICAHTDYTHNPIEYIKYSRLDSTVEIDYSKMTKNKEEQNEILTKSKIQSLFRKHEDYKGENEYRFMSFSNNMYDVIPVRECLVGIIASEKINDFAKEQLLLYTEKNQSVKLYFVAWGADEISIKNNEDQIKFDTFLKSCLDSSMNDHS